MTTTEFDTYLTGRCGNCGKNITYIPRELQSEYRHDRNSHDTYSLYEVLECPNCKHGTVANPTKDAAGMMPMELQRREDLFNLSPGPLPADLVTGMPDDLTGAWREVLSAGQVGAWTAGEMMCRKILMHVAVDQFEAPEGQSFTAYVKALDDAHFFPKMLQPLLDGIRERGNRATHDVAASPKSQAMKTIKITHHVLRTIYELANI